MVFSDVARQLHTTSAGKEEAVLRITTSVRSGITRLIIEGKLAGACIGELEKCWRATASTESPQCILVDLSSVTFIDASGKQLLTHMHEHGIRLVASGLLAKSIIKEIERSGA
jgi:anti-anti-sigma regulatory factor